MDRTGFDTRRVENALADSSVEWNVRSEVEVSSTNAALVHEAKGGAPEGTVLVARHQTEGRGRQGRAWIDRPGQDLLTSLILHPGSDPAYSGLMSLLPATAAALALHDLTAQLVHTKWPNDIMVGDRKVGGVLAHANLEAGWVVIGLGINLLGAADELPDDLLHPATTLQAATGLALHREDVLVAFLQQIETFYTPDEGLQVYALLEKYRTVETTEGRQVTVNTPTGRVSGRVEGVDERGRLLVIDGDDLHALDAGDVHMTETGK